MAHDEADEPPAGAADDALRRLTDRLEQASDAAERLFTQATEEAASRIGGSAKPPPRGWQQPDDGAGAPPPTAATNGFDGFILRMIAAIGRVVRSWRALDPKQRLAGYAAFGLFIGLFLPWYSQTVVAGGAKAPVQARSVSLNGWDAFSLVQAVAL